MKYKFYDTDIYFKEDNNISEEEYTELINICIKYSKTIAFKVFEDTIRIPSYIKQYRIPLDKTITRKFNIYGYATTPNKILSPTIYHLELTPPVCDWIHSVTDNIWGWLHTQIPSAPEDPIFFREDGSVFFSSVIHDGQCTLYSRENEDVSSIVSKGHWYYLKDDEDIFTYQPPQMPN